MKCPYLQGKYVQSCAASKEVYVPSQFEFAEYCTHSGHKICPNYYRSEYAGVSAGGFITGPLLSKTR